MVSINLGVITNNMSDLFFKYYFDLTRYNLLCSALVCFLTNRYASVIFFGTIGMVMSLFLYRYYQNIEYYFYLNAGMSKREMISKAFKINSLISIILFAIIWSMR